MKVEGRERATHGFPQPVDGWHVFQVEEGIDYAKNHETQEIMLDKKGAKKHIIPVTLVDPEDDSNGAKMSFFPAENARGEQLVADLLAATGQFKKFAEKFPGEVSVFDPPVMSAIKIKLPGQFFKGRTEINGKYCNIQETATMQFDPSKDEKAAKGKKGGEKTGETKAAAKNDEW